MRMRATSLPVKAPDWYPHMTYVWTSKELAAWYDQHGEWAMYGGVMWTPKVKNLGVGRKSIRFVRFDPQ